MCMQAQEQVRRLHDQCQELTQELQGARRRTSATGSARSVLLRAALHWHFRGHPLLRVLAPETVAPPAHAPYMCKAWEGICCWPTAAIHNQLRKQGFFCGSKEGPQHNRTSNGKAVQRCINALRPLLLWGAKSYSCYVSMVHVAACCRTT